ncbi:MAG: alpha/beta hydrolase [Desulfobacula sp.]|nr:alpha/beta hydrolase [Desulfobacula sp.]
MTRFLQLGSQKIEIQWHQNVPNNQNGHRDLPALIFLHEGLGCTSLWKDFPVKLSQKTGCPALVFSRYGYGKSDPCPLPWKINFMHKQALKTLPEIIAQAKIRQYILIGHSDGGSIGVIFSGSPTSQQPKGLRGLITEAAHVFCEKITVDCIKQAKINYEYHNLKSKLEKYHGQNTDNAFYGWNDVWLNPKFMHWNIEKYLNKIKVPMLAIQGKDDQYGTKKQIASIKQHVNNIKTHLINNCRHSPHNDQPEIVLDLMAKFIHKIITE